MPDQLTPRQFQESEGLGDWRDVGFGALACFRTGSFDRGVALVDAIGRVVADLGHHPDVDLQQATVTVRVCTPEIMGLSSLDVSLAREVSAAARSLGIAADPAAVQCVQLTIDALVTEDVRPFWRAVLGYEDVGDEDLVDPRGRGPSIWFQPMEAPRPQRNRIHVDVFVPDDEAEARVAAALAAGGRLVDDSHAPDWWTLADPEGNEVDVAVTLDRE